MAVAKAAVVNATTIALSRLEIFFMIISPSPCCNELHNVVPLRIHELSQREPTRRREVAPRSSRSFAVNEAPAKRGEPPRPSSNAWTHTNGTVRRADIQGDRTRSRRRCPATSTWTAWLPSEARRWCPKMRNGRVAPAASSSRVLSRARG
jgi:hypothetical protein